MDYLLARESIRSRVGINNERIKAGLSWAVQLGSRPELRSYWKALGLEIQEQEKMP